MEKRKCHHQLGQTPKCVHHHSREKPRRDPNLSKDGSTMIASAESFASGMKRMVYSLRKCALDQKRLQVALGKCKDDETQRLGHLVALVEVQPAHEPVRELRPHLSIESSSCAEIMSVASQPPVHEPRCLASPKMPKTVQASPLRIEPIPIADEEVKQVPPRPSLKPMKKNKRQGKKIVRKEKSKDKGKKTIRKAKGHDKGNHDKVADRVYAPCEELSGWQSYIVERKAGSKIGHKDKYFGSLLMVVRHSSR